MLSNSSLSKQENNAGEYMQLLYVIVLEKRDHFAVKLFFQYKQVKVDIQLSFVHNSACLN